MGLATELSVDAELRDLEFIVESRDWQIKRLDPVKFGIVLPAKDSSRFGLLVDCENYKELPPAFHWAEPDSFEINLPNLTPTGGGYFHGHGVICAPWNRLSYKSIDSRGPHGDWQIANWIENPHTGATTTLSAMVLRIQYELMGPNFKGRK